MAAKKKFKINRKTAPKKKKQSRVLTKVKKARQKKTTSKKKKIVPRRLGTAVDKFLKLKTKIKDLNNVISKLKSEAEAMQKKLVVDMESEKCDKISSSLGSVTYQNKPSGTVEDWDKLYDYILSYEDFSLLDKRLNQTAIRERFEAGEKVAGVKKFNKKSLVVGYKR